MQESSRESESLDAVSKKKQAGMSQGNSIQKLSS